MSGSVLLRPTGHRWRCALLRISVLGSRVLGLPSDSFSDSFTGYGLGWRKIPITLKIHNRMPVDDRCAELRHPLNPQPIQ